MMNYSNKPSSMVGEIPEHATIAGDMANRILDFNPGIQDEIIAAIKQRVLEDRQIRIKSTQEHIKHMEAELEMLNATIPTYLK